jgi:bifunctional enzyme CysN/CysC
MAIDAMQSVVASMLRLLVCGSVDDGKSTLIGRLLLDSGHVPEDQVEALAADSRVHGTVGGSIDPALLTDGLAAEREQGITIDVAWRQLQTAKRRILIADTPGHVQHTRNMATGASTARGDTRLRTGGTRCGPACTRCRGSSD